MSRLFAVFRFYTEVDLMYGLAFFGVFSKTLIKVTLVGFLCRFESSLCIHGGCYEPLLLLFLELYWEIEAGLR